MLVLSRKPSEKIRIGDDIEIMVVRLSANTVRLGITAPRGVSIVREELVDQPHADDQVDPGSIGTL